MTASAFDLEIFVQQRQPVWEALAQALDAHARDPRQGGRAALVQLLRLSRQTANDLTRLRQRTANPELLGRLDILVGRAWRELHGHRPGREKFHFSDLLLRAIPMAVQARRAALTVALLSLLAGVAIGFVGVLADPSAAGKLVPAQFFAQSPSERVADIDAGPERIADATTAAAFTSMLYTHNIQVALLSAALAATTIWLGILMMLYNGIILGAIGAQYLLDGEGLFFVAWVGPHGALEIPGLLLGAAAGFVLGRAIWLPGLIGRGASLREAAPDAWRLLVAAAVVLVAAGFVEGSFSQFSARAIPLPAKLLVAVVLHGGLLIWLFGFRWRRAHA